jgi:hypothetical protein
MSLIERGFCYTIGKIGIMYQFKITQLEDGAGYRFELGSIKMIVENYTVRDGSHILSNPDKTIAYFTIENNIYGVTNDPRNFETAEDFYDNMYKQYLIFINKNRPTADSTLLPFNNRLANPAHIRGAA